MPSNKKIKFLISVLIAGQLAAFPFLAAAQLGAVNPVPTSDVAAGSGGAAGLVANGIAVPAITAAQNANQLCANAEQSYFASNTGSTIGFGGLSLISGGSQVVASLSAKSATIDGFMKCRQAVLTLLNPISTPNIFTANSKQTIYNSASAAIANLKTQQEQVKSQLVAAEQGFWKTLVYNILIKTTQSVTTRLVGQLVQNYKIQDFEKYAGAVATQVYDNEFIQDNANGSAADQLILRSMLTNPLAQSTIQPAIYQRSTANLGFVPGTVNTSASNPNFYLQMASIAAPPNDPFVTQMTMANTAIQAHNQAMTTAQAEIAQSNGLKTPRTCGATLQQQKIIDASYKAANDQVQNRQALLASLEANPNSKPADIAQAQSDLNAALKNLQNVPNNNLDAAGNAAIDICTAIVSPPSLINQGINDALHQFDQSLGTYNNNNLPFFINAITSVATQLTNNLIFGGNQNKASILSENTGALATGAALALNAATTESQVQQNNNLVVTSQRADDGSNKSAASYTIQWDASNVSGASGVSITGPGLPANISGLITPNLTNAVNVTVGATGSYSYTVTAYGASKLDIKASVKIIISPALNPTVAGAYVARPLQPVRGPAITASNAPAPATVYTPIQPRGSME